MDLFAYKQHIRQNINRLTRLGMQKIASKLDFVNKYLENKNRVLAISCPGGH